MVTAMLGWRRLALCASLLLPCGSSQAVDPFATGKLVAAQAHALTSGEQDDFSCDFAAPTAVLELAEAIERALCAHPETRAAWAQARIQAAQLGVARGAYLPQLQASVGRLEQKSSTRYGNPYDLLDKTEPRTRTGNLKLSWTIADSGLRSATVDQARALLDAANASHDASIQATLLNAAKRYFDVQTAAAVLRASEQAERSARQNLEATSAMYEAGASALTDKLQAAVAYSDAELKRVSALGELQTLTGSLASILGLPPNTRLQLPARDLELPASGAGVAIEQLLDDARQHHPLVKASRAELEAARARVRAVRAEGRPTLTFTAEASERRQDKHIPVYNAAPTTMVLRDKVIGMQLSIPLFEGFTRSYKTQAASSQVDKLEAELERREQEVALDVWKHYQALHTRQAHIAAARTLQDSAQRSYEVAEGRYRAGVGNILELLSAQDARARAEQKRIEALAGWLSARLQLAASVGKLGLWAIR